MIASVWAITWGRCVPGHYCLLRQGTSDAYDRLMRSNLHRAILMTCRAVLLLCMVWLIWSGRT